MLYSFIYFTIIYLFYLNTCLHFYLCNCVCSSIYFCIYHFFIYGCLKKKRVTLTPKFNLGANSTTTENFYSLWTVGEIQREATPDQPGRAYKLHTGN